MIEIQIDNNTEKFNAMLKNLTFKFPVAEISEKTGFSKGSISEIIKGKRAPSDAFLKKFVEVFKIENSELFETKSIPEKSPTGFYYPDIYASAGLETEMINDELNRIPVNIPNWEKGIEFINVYGDSMYPKYCSGEIIGIKEVQPEYLNYGYAYVVIFNDGQVFLKYINPGSDKEHWILSSENPKNPPREYHLSLIKKIFIIKGVITKTTM